jgi:hypothetical protein
LKVNYINQKKGHKKILVPFRLINSIKTSDAINMNKATMKMVPYSLLDGDTKNKT